MGLTRKSTGKGAIDLGMGILRRHPSDHVIAIAGNPNVGKSTLFNQLTGMKQHTGNWPGKTVSNAQGFCRSERENYVLVDIPGTYSLMAHSAEEEIARDFLCFADHDGILVICDATCLERNMNLVLQILERSGRVLVCVNLMDEARRKDISVDLDVLSQKLGVPVIGSVARDKKSVRQLLKSLDRLITLPSVPSLQISYPPVVEHAIAIAEPAIIQAAGEKLPSRWLTLRLLDQDPLLLEKIQEYLGEDILKRLEVKDSLSLAWEHLGKYGITPSILKDRLVSSLTQRSQEICCDAVSFHNPDYSRPDRKLDQILTSPVFGYPIMLGMLAFIFWLTISGANYPSQLLSDLLFKFQDTLTYLFQVAHAPEWLHGILVLGAYRVLAWVVAVMLPPMAIFFPLFTLLEDAGILPRIAYNLDKPFQLCRACGKQALTMAMGFGCNAAGIVGCRIIDSPRERLIAMLTNNFVPCNGRFPTLIALISIFFAGSAPGLWKNGLSALILTGFVLLGILMTFAVSKLLSSTILKGMSSSFTLELPPYRRPQIGRILIRSLFDRTLFVLGRAAAVAAPAGILIWIMANVTVGDVSLLSHCNAFLDPFARTLGLDGVILTAFLLGLPANEIIIPIILMSYLSQGSLADFESLGQLKELLVNQGWTWATAVSVMLFSLMHWPCTTTLLTIRKESGSWKWTVLACLIPTACGILACFLFHSAVQLFF